MLIRTASLACMIAAGAFAQCEQEVFKNAGWLGDIALVDGYAVGFGAGAYRVFDVSNADDPQLILSQDLGLPGTQVVKIVDDLAYAFSGTQLAVIDIADVMAPEVLGEATNLAGIAYLGDIAIAGDYAYVTTGHNGKLIIVNIADPADPYIAGTENAPDSHGIEVLGTTLYMCRQEWGDVELYSIANNPTDPQYMGTIDGVNDARDVIRHGNRAYLPGEEHLYIIDVSAHSEPQLIGVSDTIHGFRAVDVVIIGSTAYVSRFGGGGMTTMDVLDPLNIQVIQELETSARNVRYNGFSTVMRSSYGWFTTLDVEDVGHPSVAGEIIMPRSGGAVARDGDITYVVDDFELFVYDLTAAFPSMPVGYLEFPEHLSLESFAQLNGDYLYAVVNDTLYTLDVADPTTPTIVSAISMSNVNDLVLAGDHLFAVRNDVLSSYNVTVPDQPAPAGAFPTDDTRSVDVEGDYAFLTADQSLIVLDVTDPGAMVEVASLAIGNAPYGIGVDDGLAVILRGADDAFHVLDVSDPTQPEIIATHSAQLFAYGFGAELEDDLAYIAGPNGWEVFDVSFPESPVHVGELEPSYNDSIDVRGRLAATSGSRPFVEYDLGACNGCPADVNDDNTINILDFVTFQILWKAADPAADCNNDGQFSILDFACFQAVYLVGCN